MRFIEGHSIVSVAVRGRILVLRNPLLFPGFGREHTQLTDLLFTSSLNRFNLEFTSHRFGICPCASFPVATGYHSEQRARFFWSLIQLTPDKT